MPKITKATTKNDRSAPQYKLDKGKSEATPQPELFTITWVAPPSLSALLEWFDEQGIWTSDKLEAKDLGEGSGWGVVARDEGVPLEVVCKIPRTAILSIHNSNFSNLVPPQTWRQIPLLAQLSLTLLHEIRAGSQSRFYGYLQSLPREHVPIIQLWGTESICGEDGRKALEIVRGTEVDRELKRMVKEERSLAELRTYHAATSSYFPTTPTSANPPTLPDLLYAYSLVTSRAFQVDVYHGAAMVPLADLFNHREDNHVCFESDDFVCPECGSLSSCVHDDIISTEPIDPSLPSSSNNTFPIASRLSHLPLEIIRSFLNPSQNTVDLTVKTPFVPGEEIFNTYGEGIGWAKMLMEWGFIDDTGDSLGKGIRWDLKEVLREEKEGYEGRRKLWKALCAQDEGAATDEAEEQEEEGPFFRPEEGEDVKNSLLINSDGQMAMPLFWACVALAMPGTSVDEKPKSELVDTALLIKTQIEQSWHTPFTKNSKAGMHKIVWVVWGIVVALVTMRQDRRLWGKGKSVGELLDMIDNMTTSERLQKMALKLVVEERKVLEVVRERWDHALGGDPA